MSSDRYEVGRAALGPLDRAATRLRYVTVARYSEDWLSRLHTHPCAEMFFVTGGRGTLRLADRRLPIGEHDTVLINPDTPHTEESTPEAPLEYIVLGVDGLHPAGAAAGYAVLHAEAWADRLRFCLDLLLQEAEAKRPGYETVCQDLMEILLVMLERRTGPSVRSTGASPRASKECAAVHSYIDEHYREPLTLEDLAGVAHVNRYYLAHAFTREYGISPIRYQLERRIRESLHLLAETRLTLAEIAETLGFSSPSYFSQCFKRSQGVPPLAYRALCRKSRADA